MLPPKPFCIQHQCPRLLASPWAQREPHKRFQVLTCVWTENSRFVSTSFFPSSLPATLCGPVHLWLHRWSQHLRHASPPPVLSSLVRVAQRRQARCILLDCWVNIGWSFQPLATVKQTVWAVNIGGWSELPQNNLQKRHWAHSNLRFHINSPSNIDLDAIYNRKNDLNSCFVREIPLLISRSGLRVEIFGFDHLSPPTGQRWGGRTERTTGHVWPERRRGAQRIPRAARTRRTASSLNSFHPTLAHTSFCLFVCFVPTLRTRQPKHIEHKRAGDPSISALSKPPQTQPAFHPSLHLHYSIIY